MIRGLVPTDIPLLKAIHQRMGLEYPFPDLRITDVARVACDESSEPFMAALAVPIPECYLLMDRSKATPGERFRTLVRLHEAMREDLKGRGYRFAQADIPPEIERSFGKRLRNLGWVKSEWPTWVSAV